MIYTNNKILTSNDLKIIWGNDWNSFKKRLSYNLKTKKLIKIRKWLYVLGGEIENLQMDDYYFIANSIYTPSYISFETVLIKHGVNFQYYSNIFVASKYKKDIWIKALNLNLEYIKIPDWLLTNPIWINNVNGYNIASIERAICDVIFRSGSYHFDNFSRDINKNSLLEIAKIYDNYKKGFKDKISAIIKQN